MVFEGLLPIEGGGPGPLERSGKVKVGDRLTAINGKRVVGLTFDDAIGVLREATERPLVLRFDRSSR